jgi:hypothetical protein
MLSDAAFCVICPAWGSGWCCVEGEVLAGFSCFGPECVISIAWCWAVPF